MGVTADIGGQAYPVIICADILCAAYLDIEEGIIFAHPAATVAGLAAALKEIQDQLCLPSGE